MSIILHYCTDCALHDIVTYISISLCILIRIDTFGYSLILIDDPVFFRIYPALTMCLGRNGYLRESWVLSSMILLIEVYSIQVIMQNHIYY